MTDRNAFRQIYAADSPSIDAFGRWRVSEPVTLFDNTFQYSISSLLWTNAASGGSVSHVANTGAARLSNGGTTANQYAYLQTYQYFRYQPGKSQAIEITFTLGAAATGVRKRVGYFDASDGIYLEQTAAGVRLVRRTYVSGSVVNNEVEQADWSISSTNTGGAPSVEIDWTKAQILHIDLQFLGVGRVRVGFVINGALVYVHEFLHSNVISTLYMRTGSLPLRAEIYNTATASGTVTFDIYCCTVISEGGFEEGRGIPWAAGNGVTAISVSTRRAVLSIRAAATNNSIVNHGTIFPRSYDLYATSQSIYYEIVYGGALGGTPSWGSVGTGSIAEFDVAGTTVTGGVVIANGFLPASASTRVSAANAITSKLPLTLNLAGDAAAQVLSVVATAFTGTASVSAGMQWEELY